MKILDFISFVNYVLQELGKSTQDLFENKIVSANTFYKYKQRNPSLKTLLKVANYLEVSIDYLFERTVENNFKPYDLKNCKFYSNLIKLIHLKNISGRTFCKDLNYSRDNLIRWKNGIQPNTQTLIEIADYLNCNIDDLLL